MDKYHLKFVTLCDTDLQEKISKIPDPERITTLCTNGKIENPDTFSSADVIFMSYQQATEHLDKILGNKASYTQIVLLADDTLTETVNEKLLPFDLWDTNGRAILHHISALKEKMLACFDLELKENQLYTLIDSVPDLIWYKDTNGLHIDVNEPFCQSIGKNLDDIRGEIKYRDQGYLMGLTPEEFANGEFACVTTDNIVLKEQKTSLFDEKVLIHGEMRQFKTYKTALKGRNGESIGTVGMAHDVTDIWNTHEEFRIVISRLPFPMIILDKNHNLLSYNSKFLDFFHCTDEILNTFEFVDFGQQAFQCDITMPESKNGTMEKEVIHEGKSFYILIEKSEITDVFGEISGYFYIFRDYTKTYEYEEQLRVMAETDELTQIYNRKFIREFFETKLRVFVKEKLSFAVAIVDIDYFKNYNDHYGHIEGDTAIKEIASILKHHSDNEKIFVARFGGEEFIVMAIAKTKSEVKGLLTSLQKGLKLAKIPHEKSAVSDILTMSIGCYYLEELKNDMHLADLVEIADKYLYEAKEQGRNKVVSNISENISEIPVKAQRNANFDTLTNVLTATAMREVTSDMLLHSNKEQLHALFLLNLNDFKGVNDNLGVAFEDSLLRELGKRLRESVRSHDLVGYVGGNQFAILLRSIPSSEILRSKAKMLLSTVSENLTDETTPHNFHGSLGIAVYPDHGTNYEELYHNANLALYSSKHEDKNMVTMYQPDMKKE